MTIYAACRKIAKANKHYDGEWFFEGYVYMPIKFFEEERDCSLYLQNLGDNFKMQSFNLE